MAPKFLLKSPPIFYKYESPFFSKSLGYQITLALFPLLLVKVTSKIERSNIMMEIYKLMSIFALEVMGAGAEFLQG